MARYAVDFYINCEDFPNKSNELGKLIKARSTTLDSDFPDELKTGDSLVICGVRTSCREGLTSNYTNTRSAIAQMIKAVDMYPIQSYQIPKQFKLHGYETIRGTDYMYKVVTAVIRYESSIERNVTKNLNFLIDRYITKWEELQYKQIRHKRAVRNSTKGASVIIQDDDWFIPRPAYFDGSTLVIHNCSFPVPAISALYYLVRNLPVTLDMDPKEFREEHQTILLDKLITTRSSSAEKANNGVFWGSIFAGNRLYSTTYSSQYLSQRINGASTYVDRYYLNNFSIDGLYRNFYKYFPEHGEIFYRKYFSMKPAIYARIMQLRKSGKKYTDELKKLYDDLFTEYR